jgi:transposase InsO family protein
VYPVFYRRTRKLGEIRVMPAAPARAGKPKQNAFIESFIGRLRDELLNEVLLRSSHTPAP